MNKYEKLTKNALIFLIGNFGSKVLSFLIVPLYTWVLTTEEYGIIDIINNLIMLMVPFVILGINDAVLRFLLSKEMKPETVASNCFFIFLAGSVLLWILFPVYRYLFFGKTAYSLLFALILTSSCFNSIFTQFLKGIGENSAYALSGVLSTLVLIGGNVLLLRVFSFGVKGYLISVFLSYLFVSAFLFGKTRLWRYLSIRWVDFTYLKQLLSFSIPLIPNSIFWWIMNASDKFVLSLYYGTSANGVYSIAQKFPAISSMIYAFFLQAWQMAAIEEDNSPDKVVFHQQLFRAIVMILSCVSALSILVIVPCCKFLLGEGFRSAWEYVSTLLIANIFSSISSFFGVNYATSKKTMRTFATTLLGAVLNTGLNFLLIPKIGIQGAAIATAASFACVGLLRWRDAERILRTKFELRKVILSVILIGLQGILLVLYPGIVGLVGSTILAILVVLVYVREIGMFVKVVKNRLLAKKPNTT